MVEISPHIEEELHKKSEEIRFLNDKLQSLRSNLFESSKNLENMPNVQSARTRLNENNRLKHYSLDPEFLKNNAIPRPENQENEENNQKVVEYEKMNKLLVDSNNEQGEQLKKMAKKMEFLSTEFEKSLKEKTMILQEQMKLLKDNSDFIKENQFLHNENKKLLLEIEGFHINGQKEKKEREGLQKDLSMKTQEMETLRKELGMLNEKTAKVMQNYEKIKVENEGLMSNKMKIIETMSMEMNKSSGEINDFKQKYQHLLDNKKMIENDNEYLREKNEELESQLKSYQEKFVFELEKKDMTIFQLKNELEVKYGHIQELENGIRNLHKEVEQKDLKVIIIDDKCLAFNKEIEILNSHKWSLKKQNDNLSRENSKLKNNWEESQEKMREYEKKIEDMMYSYTLQRNKILGEYKDLSYKCEELEMELKNYKTDPDSGKLQEINKKMDEVHAIHTDLDEQIKNNEARRECVIQ